MLLLKGKNALITGGASGIGKSTAIHLANAGANVAVADINMDMAKKTADELCGKGIKAQAYFLDIADVKGHPAFIDRIEREFGGIDILVNNAGVTNKVDLLEMSPEEWDLVMNINARGTFFISQAAFRHMLKRKRGRIINLGSISGERGAKYAGAHYSVSKAAVIMMSKVFAKYASDSGVTINTVSPGIIKTEMTERLGTRVNPEDVPMNRMGLPEDIANTIVFLSSDCASYITGQNISVNGGQSMR
jgi:3-oxoacyl-[acyl-carrier protein] reductase